eukprot:TRINITY_DN6339_c0_g1_i2.p1 TRINITY_DN6339_c0_g1~~TRINITY_DN6339_c0_g1_i2.p1  ORF type:complete len:893 (+),score=293.15 TRINITY_DN6339_c0_g1_i2:108-2786(+)
MHCTQSTVYSITGATNPMTEARREQAKKNQEVFEEVRQKHLQLMLPNGAPGVDCGLWELMQEGSVHDVEGYDRRLKARKQQRDAIIDLVTEKVRDNYTRFVAGINKIQEVGNVSARTTQICDAGIGSIRATKSGLVLNALSLAGNHRKRENMKAVRELAVKARTIYGFQKEVQRQLKAGAPTEALVAMIQGERAAEGMHHIESIRALVYRWKEDKTRLYRDHVGHLLEQSCVTFNPAQFASVAKAAALMGREEEAARELTQKWWKYVKKTLTCVRPHAAKTHALESLINADARQLIQMCTAHNIVLALFDVLHQLTDKMWGYLTMLQYCEDNGYAVWAKELQANKGEYWRVVQNTLSLFFHALQTSFQTLELASMLDIHVAYRVFDAFLTRFHKAVDPKLDAVVDKLTERYLREVFHKGNIEITRVQAVTEKCIPLMPQEIFQRVKETLSAGMAVPTEDAVKRLCRQAHDFAHSSNPLDNPFSKIVDKLYHARAPPGEAELNEKMQSFLAISADGLASAKVTLSGVDMIIRLSNYTDIMVAFPRLARVVDSLKTDLVGFLAYSVYCTYCGVEPKDGNASPTVKDKLGMGGSGNPEGHLSYVPEKDAYIGANDRKHLEAVRGICLRLLAKGAQKAAVDTADGPTPANPLLSLVAPHSKRLNSSAKRLGLIERSVALSSLKFVVDYSARTEHGVAARDSNQMNQTQDTLAAMTRSMRKRLAFHLFPLDHYAKAIAESKFEPKTLDTEPSLYVNKMIKELRDVTSCLTTDSEVLARLPKDVPYHMWAVLIENLMYTMIEGFSKVKKCNSEGRALMQLDVQSIQHALKAMVPGALPSMEPVDDYIKAFYHTFEGLLEWMAPVHSVWRCMTARMCVVYARCACSVCMTDPLYRRGTP